MIIRVNGRDREVLAAITIAGLLNELNLTPEGVVVELNRTILRSKEELGQRLQEGDALELIRFVGGG